LVLLWRQLLGAPGQNRRKCGSFSTAAPNVALFRVPQQVTTKQVRKILVNSANPAKIQRLRTRKGENGLKLAADIFQIHCKCVGRLRQIWSNMGIFWEFAPSWCPIS
jgi:hypothetical protein